MKRAPHRPQAPGPLRATPLPLPVHDARPDRNRVALAFVCAIAVVSVALHFTPDARALFGWRAAPHASPVWTTLSSQCVHLGRAHLLANLGALVMLAVVARQLGVLARLPLLLLASLLAVAVGLIAGPWPVAWYMGLSGALHGVFAALALELALRAGPARWLGWGLLLGAGVKLALELDAGTGHIGALGIPVAPPAHVYGYIGGLITAWLPRLRRDA